jgi:hypothetical protein
MQNNRYLLLFFTFFLLFFLFSCKSKPKEISIIPDALKNHLQRAHLFGDIHKIETNYYYYSEKDSIHFFSNKSIQIYSSDGYLTQVTVLDKNNDSVSQRTVHYLPNAREKYWKDYNYISTTVTIDTFIYDNNGFKCEEQIWTNDSLMYKIQYKTDAIGSIIEMKRFLSEYQLVNKMYYNDFGLVSRIEEYNPNNILYKFFTIEYDNYGDEVNRRAFKSNNEMIEYTYTQYNDAGWLLKVIFEDRLHNLREDRIYSQHDTHGNWKKEYVIQGSDTLGKKARMITYY